MSNLDQTGRRCISSWYFCASSRYVGRYTVSRNVFSIIVKCWHDSQADTTRVQVVRTDTAEEVRLDSGSFLLRITADDAAHVERCFIQHIASGREVYIQSGLGLRSFIKACLDPDKQ